MKRINLILIILVFLFSFNKNDNRKASEKYREVPIYILSPKLKDSINNFIFKNRMQLKDSCFLVYINTMDSSGELLQISIVPQKQCHLQAYDFYIDHTFGIGIVDSIIVFIYGRSIIDHKLARRTNSYLFVKELQLNEEFEQSDEFFPETKFINFRE
jgi:hypothetical protein